MKIKTKKLAYSKIAALTPAPHKDPVRPNALFRALIRLLSAPELMSTHFTYTQERMEAAGDGPWLVLMNHSAFIDLKIASKILRKRPFNIVCTSDGFVGKDWLMRHIGCIPTNKFTTDVGLMADIRCALNKGCHVLMYPEASYSFDGTATPLPRRMGLFLKRLGVPVVMITTHGAFTHDPLYNSLQLRKVPVSADMRCLFSADELKTLPADRLDKMLDEAFSFDNFAWQRDNNIRVSEPFRADGLNRILYKCAACNSEGQMEGRGTELVCHSCGRRYELDELGRLVGQDTPAEFAHIPDWYNWQRQQVRRELEEGTYRLDIPVDIGIMADHKAIYMVGEGRLIHDLNGFTLTGCDGQLEYHQPPLYNYSLYSDYYWYEIGDVISIGGKDAQYYCFPKDGDVVAKTRLAAEELYKICHLARQERRSKRAGGQIDGAEINSINE